MSAHPPVELLDNMIITDKGRDVPLHAQVRRAMSKVIEEHFVDGQQFWTEQMLTERLNVSQITVRRALNDLAKNGVLMRRAAKGTFVRKPNHALSTDYRVAVFVPGYASNILASLLDQLAKSSNERGRVVQTYLTHKGQRINEAFLSLDQAPEKQRLIALGNPHDATTELLQLAADRGYRVVCIEGTVPQKNADYIGMDDVEGMRVAVGHLRDLGHERITLIVNEPFRLDQVMQRQIAFERICASWNLAGRVVSSRTEFWESAHDGAYRVMPEVWNSDERPTAILTVSDAGAWAALRWLAENGISVPNEVSVMGFDDDSLSRITHPALTTLGRDVVQMANCALDYLDRPTCSRETILLEPHLIQRESTGRL